MNTILLLLACAPDPIAVRGDSIGSCEYTSRFSNEPECRDFFDGEQATAEAACAKETSTFEPGVTCSSEGILGTCTYEGDDIQMRATVYGDDETKCGSQKFGCETFAGGYWEPGANCEGEEEIAVLENPFPLPEQICVDPIDGEAPGTSEDGQVCTWEMVSGSTEEGRAFADYASCDTVIRQRPYSPVPANPLADEADPRLDDPAYVEELGWVKSQLRSSSCDCCHSAKAPDGPSVFNIDFEGNFANQFSDRGVAMGAGWVPTVGFGTYPAEENNGFERASLEEPNLSAFPTTDQARMMAFFMNELNHRGRTQDEFADDLYGAGPLDEQLYYEPERCSTEEGIGSDGILRWLPGRARFIYVLEVGSLSPTVPPNLWLPEGTLWRVDLPMDGDPVPSGTVRYGEVPEGMTQAWPLDGGAPPLEMGKDYYLYAAADIMYPISRCIFTAGEDPEPTGCASTGAEAGLLPLVIGALALRRRRTR